MAILSYILRKDDTSTIASNVTHPRAPDTLVDHRVLDWGRARTNIDPTKSASLDSTPLFHCKCVVWFDSPPQSPLILRPPLLHPCCCSVGCSSSRKNSTSCCFWSLARNLRESISISIQWWPEWGGSKKRAMIGTVRISWFSLLIFWWLFFDVC